MSNSIQKGKLSKKDRQNIKQKHRRQLQQAKLQKQRQQARQQIQSLKSTGLVTAYEQFLRSICKNGLPQPSNVYEMAAQFVLKYDKKQREKFHKKQQLEKFNKDAVRKNSINNDSVRMDSPGKSRVGSKN